MLQTIKISQYSERVLLAWVKHSIAVSLLATLFSPIVPAVWGAQFENADTAKGDKPKVDKDKITNDEIAQALSNPPIVPPEAQDQISSFLDHTLPKLLADDERFAHQLGFGDGVSNLITIDRALAIMVIRRDDVIKLMKEKKSPLDLVNNTNNWLEDEAGRLVPRRIVFLLKAHDSASEAGDLWSSVTMEQSGDGSSWRIIQVGAPKLSQAMNQYGASGGNYFLLWIPDLNRHYLGSIKNHLITLKVLFKDRLLNGDPNDNQPINSEYLLKLKQLYEELDLPKKSRPKTDEAQTPAQENRRRR